VPGWVDFEKLLLLARFAVPCVRLADKSAALHTDRGTLTGFAASATGSAKPVSPNELRSPVS